MSEARVEVSPVVSGYRVTVEVAAGPDDGRVREVWLNEDECLLFFRRRGRRPDAGAEDEDEPLTPPDVRRGRPEGGCSAAISEALAGQAAGLYYTELAARLGRRFTDRTIRDNLRRMTRDGRVVHTEKGGPYLTQPPE